MKKILIVNDHFPPDHWGGSNSVAFLQAKALRERGWDARVFATTQNKEDSLGWTEYEGIPVCTFYTQYHPRWWAWRSLYNPQVVGEFKKLLKEFEPEIIHFHNIHHYFSYHTISIARETKAKVFLTAHDVMSFAYQKLHNFVDYDSKAIPTEFNYYVPWWVNMKDARLRFNPFRNLFIRYYLRKVNQIFAVSNALKQALADNGIIGNVSVVHNGIDARVFKQEFDEHALRSTLGIENTPTVLFVGRFTPDKGRDVLLRAFAKVLKTAPQAKLLVVGFNADRRHEPVMWRIIEELNIEKNIVFVSAVEYIYMYRYYRMSDVVVVPSIIFDSFPTANLEGMAAGKPVVATCFGGSREVVGDQQTGYIVNPLDIEVFATRIIKLITDVALASRFGVAGHTRVVRDFSLGAQLDAYREHYAIS